MQHLKRWLLLVSVVLACLLLAGGFWAWTQMNRFFSQYTDTVFWQQSFEEKFHGDVEVKPPEIPDRVCDALAPPGGSSASQTRLLQSSIDACAEDGGGLIVLKEGNWNLQPLELRSDIELRFREGARVFFDSPRVYDGYTRDTVLGRFEGIEAMVSRPLLWADDASNILLSGEGELYGGGADWYDIPQLRETEQRFFRLASADVENGIPAEERSYRSQGVYVRPDFFLCRKCERVAVEDLTFRDHPRWGLHFVFSEDITIENVTLEAEGPNTDAIVFDSSSDGIVRDTDIIAGDDAIVMKSGINEEGREIDIPTKDIVLESIDIESAHGGIVMGSEMSGGIENILAEDISVENAWSAARIKAPRERGGYVRNIVFRNIAFEDIEKSAIEIDMRYEYNADNPEAADAPLPHIGPIFYEHIHGERASRVAEIDGLPDDAIHGLFFDGLYAFESTKGVAIRHAENVIMKDVSLFLEESSGKKAFELRDVARMLVWRMRLNDWDSRKIAECENEEKTETPSRCGALLVHQQHDGKAEPRNPFSDDGLLLENRRWTHPLIHLATGRMF